MSISVASPIALTALSAEQLAWVQSRLKLGGFYAGAADGRPTDATRKAFAEFKESAYLEYPDLIGNSTIAALSALQAPHHVTEQGDVTPITRNAQAGSKTGKSLKLPKVGLVYANQWIIEGVPLTWGEVTKNMTRVPQSEAAVMGILRIAKPFGFVRDKMGCMIAINSGYRPPDVNRAIGGASRSRHVTGDALDMRPANGNFPEMLSILKVTPGIGGIGLGQKKGFLHADARPLEKGEAIVIWRY